MVGTSEREGVIGCSASALPMSARDRTARSPPRRRRSHRRTGIIGRRRDASGMQHSHLPSARSRSGLPSRARLPADWRGTARSAGDAPRSPRCDDAGDGRPGRRRAPLHRASDSGARAISPGSRTTRAGSSEATRSSISAGVGAMGRAEPRRRRDAAERAMFTTHSVDGAITIPRPGPRAVRSQRPARAAALGARSPCRPGPSTTGCGRSRVRGRVYRCRSHRRIPRRSMAFQLERVGQLHRHTLRDGRGRRPRGSPRSRSTGPRCATPSGPQTVAEMIRRLRRRARRRVDRRRAPDRRRRQGVLLGRRPAGARRRRLRRRRRRAAPQRARPAAPDPLACPSR